MPPEKKVPTSAGQETATETVNRINKTRETGTVSANDLVNEVKPVTLPEPIVNDQQPDFSTVQNVVNSGNEIISAQTEEAKQLKELRNQQASFAKDTSLSDLFQQGMSEYQVPENLKRLKDLNMQIAGMNTESLGKRSDTLRADGQTVNQGSREISAEQARNNVRTYGLGAEAAILQGNINTATNLVNQAVQLAYQDRTLRNTNMVNQINSLQSVVDNQTAQLLEKDKRQYEEDQKEIDKIQNAVENAVTSGLATPDDISVLTKDSDPKKSYETDGEYKSRVKKEDKERYNKALEIVARKAERERLANEEAQRASTAASWALASQRWADTGANLPLPDGGNVQVPSFEEWAKENGGKGYAMGSLNPEQIAALKSEYEDDMDVVARANALNTVSPLAREVLKNPKGYFDLTPTKRGEILEELARAGIDTSSLQDGNKKKLSATQVDDLAQAQLAKRNVQELYNMLKQVPGTGPIAGRIKSLDPYDPLVADIKAQINRTVPGLARGIFKEVGVLTDADVERYAQTLANFNFTDAQIEQLNNSTVSLIDDSINMTTSLYSDLGYDLGTFSPDNMSIDDGLTDDEAWAEYQKQVNSNN